MALAKGRGTLRCGEVSVIERGLYLDGRRTHCGSGYLYRRSACLIVDAVGRSTHLPASLCRRWTCWLFHVRRSNVVGSLSKAGAH